MAACADATAAGATAPGAALRTRTVILNANRKQLTNICLALCIRIKVSEFWETNLGNKAIKGHIVGEECEDVVCEGFLPKHTKHRFSSNRMAGLVGHPTSHFVKNQSFSQVRSLESIFALLHILSQFLKPCFQHATDHVELATRNSNST